MMGSGYYWPPEVPGTYTCMYAACVDGSCFYMPESSI